MLDVTVEPNNSHLRSSLQPLPKKGPDLLIKGCGKDILVDVSVLCPHLPSHAFSTARNLKTTQCVEYRQTAKTTKFAEITERQRGTFYPFVMESTGGFGPLSLQLLRLIATHATRLNPTISFSDCFNTMVADISSCLQRGNLAALQAGISLIPKR